MPEGSLIQTTNIRVPPANNLMGLGPLNGTTTFHMMEVMLSNFSLALDIQRGCT